MTYILNFSDENFKRQISILNFKVDQLSEDISKLLRNNLKDETELKIEETIFNKFDFPIKTKEELKNFDRYFELSENKSKVAS